MEHINFGYPIIDKYVKTHYNYYHSIVGILIHSTLDNARVRYVFNMVYDK